MASVMLAWDSSPTATVTNYAAYLSVGTMSFLRIGSTNGLTFPVNPPTDSVSRYYATAIAAEIESLPSNTVTNNPIVTPPPAPAPLQGFSVGAISYSQMSIHWTDTNGGQAETVIERGTSVSGSFYQVARIAAGVVSFVDYNLASNKRYCYRAKAVNASGQSAYTGPFCDRTFKR